MRKNGICNQISLAITSCGADDVLALEHFRQIEISVLDSEWEFIFDEGIQKHKLNKYENTNVKVFDSK